MLTQSNVNTFEALKKLTEESAKNVSEFNKMIEGFVDLFKPRRRVFQLMDAKLNPILPKLNNIFNVMSNRATVQQGRDQLVNEEEVPKGNLNSSYQTGKIVKMANAKKIVLERKTMEDKLKTLKEMKFGWKELTEQAKRNEELDALNALIVKFDAKEAENKIFEEILASKKSMFLEWTIAQI
ncbi:unnamed protein product [Lactuca saligna]|uniref:Uncharacterized protein n=1 Tax=Lactuca saligna TaxID=75948 RepID=A0AA35ZQH8_LACSI|nr:unnamed protein product [Lactuca saligna]